MIFDGLEYRLNCILLTDLPFHINPHEFNRLEVPVMRTRPKTVCPAFSAMLTIIVLTYTITKVMTCPHKTVLKSLSSIGVLLTRS